MKTKEQTKKEEKDEKKYNIFQWFLFIFVIPFAFTIIMTIVVLTLSGLHPIDLAKQYGSKIPGISTVIGSNKNKAQALDPKIADQTTKKASDQNVTNATNQNGINQKSVEPQTIDPKLTDVKLETELENKTAEINRLTNELKTIQNQQANDKMKLEDLGRVYEKMSSKQAALSITKMDNQDAIDILTQLNDNTRASIMDQMDPTKVAELTVLMKKPVDSKQGKDNNNQNSVAQSAQVQATK